MATTATATLNGGPTGGLHATTIIHSEESQQGDTCRVDSNSSFDSGHDELQNVGSSLNLEDTSMSNWPSCSDRNSAPTNMESAGFSNDPSMSKKRRKQSRPVRIPASEVMATAPMSQRAEAGGCAEENTATPMSPTHPNENYNYAERTDEGEESEESADESKSNLWGRHSHENDPRDSGMRIHHHHQAPLNLSSSNSGRNEDGGSVEGNMTNSGQFHLAKEELMEVDRVMVGNEKTELGGQGTKDSLRNSNPSFPPAPLLPLIGSSQFFSFFPNGQAAGTQQSSSSLPVNLQMQPQQAGTPSSSSSVGSNGNQQHGGTLLNTTSSSSNPLQNIPPHRIFNPEAYCDLCNKEFCNKYFLKTHKANKHGVYTEGPSSSAVMPPSQVMAAAAALTATIPTSPSAPFIGIGQAMIQPQATINQPTVVPAPSNLNLNVKTSCKTDLSSQVTRPTLSMDMKGVTGGGREAFCNLCQKEFCNKYFLKRHKAKIHGIPMDSLPQRSAPKSSRPGCSNGAEKNSLLLPSDLELSLEIVKHMDTSGGGIEEGELVKGESHGHVSGHTSPGQEPRMRLSGSIPREQQSEDDQQQQNSQGDDLRLKLSPAATAMKIPIGLTHFGASAAPLSENTCQFCLREFSSKSQLRSHLTKKHRLLLPTFPPFLLPFPGMGSNLLDESSSPQAMAASAECDSFEQSENCPKEEADYECTLCGRSFQTVYLLRMHKSYFHPESEDSLAAISVSHEARNRMDESSDMDSGDNTSAPPNNNTGDSNKGSSLGMLGEGEGEPEAETTSDSDDLRRLQTMILELNRASSSAQSASWSPPPEFVGPGGAIALTGADLSTASSGPTVCTICSKEFYSSYFLHQHIQHYHSSSAGEAGNKDKDDSTSKKATSELFEGKTSPSIQVHREKTKETVSSVNSDVSVPLPLAPPSSFLAPGPKNCSPSSGGASRDSSAKSDASSGKRPSPSLSRSYCTICHKELCNKYFMRTHMLKMHGISIESSTGLGGVTCDICNKELCSKYFLKVHKQNTHGIVDEGPSPPNPSTPGPLPPSSGSSSTSAEPAGAMTQTGELSQVLTANQPGGDAGSRYLCHYSEVCTFCGRRFRSPKWLKTHLMSDHGQEGKDKWKSIEKSLQQQQSRKQPKGGSSVGMSSSKSSSGKSSSKSKSSSSSASAGQLGIASNGSNGNKCALCGFTTQDVEVMKVHLMKEHANQLGASETGAVGMSYGDAHRVVLDPLALLFQKMEDGSNKLYRCAYCPFATTLLVYLYAHERTHTGLANSVTASQQQQPQSQATSNDGASFQCPLCFHTFQQVDAFQQHLLGHQMSGVLAPFFNPPTSPPPSRFPFPAPKSPTSLEQQQQQQQPILPAFSSALSMLNGAISGSSDGLYWALKNSATSGSRGERQTPDLRLADVLGQDERTSGKEIMEAASESGHRRREPGSRGPPSGPQDPGHADEGSGMVEDEADDDNDENDETLLLATNAQEEKFRKRRKLSRFRCSCCSACFRSRRECFNHIQQNHSKKQKRNFRCRKCKFVSSQYQRLIIHSRVHHGKRRGFQSENLDAERRTKLKNWSGRDDKAGSGIGTGLPQGRAIPQQGVLGDYVMQSFLLCCSSDDEKSSGSRKGDGGEDVGGGGEDEERHGKKLRPERHVVLKEEKRKEEATVEDENEIDHDGHSRNNNNGSFLEKIQSDLFVPSLVYLPVREKVSQSLRVSFSLTPTS